MKFKLPHNPTGLLYEPDLICNFIGLIESGIKLISPSLTKGDPVFYIVRDHYGTLYHDNVPDTKLTTNYEEIIWLHNLIVEQFYNVGILSHIQMACLLL